MGFALGLSYDRLPPQVPLFYSRPEGENQIADTIYLVIIPLIQWTLILCNMIFYKKLFKDTIFIKKILEFLNIAIIIITTYIFIRVLFLIA